MNIIKEDDDVIEMTICKQKQSETLCQGIMSIQNACHPARENFITAVSRANQECTYASPLSILLEVVTRRFLKQYLTLNGRASC